MAELGRKTTIVPSMLDRLLDSEPDVSREAANAELATIMLRFPEQAAQWARFKSYLRFR